MARKAPHPSPDDPAQSHTDPSRDPSRDPIRESASQIWLAGLGAFAKAQEEGTKVFDALVREGTAIQRRTQEATEETLSEAAERINSMAQNISSRATGQWDKLETLFEERVGRALQRLGVATTAEIADLVHRIEALERQSSRAHNSARTPPSATADAAEPPRRRSASRAAPRKKT